MGVFGTILIKIVKQADETNQIMFDQTHLKPYQTPLRFLARTKGSVNTKLHVICDGQGRPLRMLPSPD
jgi:hypothetical protein